jgi:6-phosphofructokinase 1
MGVKAVELILEGASNQMVAVRNGKPIGVPFTVAFTEKHTPDLTLYPLTEQLSI